MELLQAGLELGGDIYQGFPPPLSSAPPNCNLLQVIQVFSCKQINILNNLKILWDHYLSINQQVTYFVLEVGAQEVKHQHHQELHEFLVSRFHQCLDHSWEQALNFLRTWQHLLKITISSPIQSYRYTRKLTNFTYHSFFTATEVHKTSYHRVEQLSFLCWLPDQNWSFIH